MKSILVISMLVLFAAGCTETQKDKNVTGSDDTMVLQNEDNLSGNKIDYTNWNVVDLGAPIVKYDEIKSREIEVRNTTVGGDSASVYTIDDNILFDFDEATLRDEGKQKLDEISASIKQRYATGSIGIYGYTDSIGSQDYNKDLSAERAAAVEQYLSQQTSIDTSRINTFARGEKNPVATNATPAGRQKNRRVDIVAADNH